MKIYTELNKNISKIKAVLSSDDIEFMDIKIQNTGASIIFLKDTTDKTALGELILKPISELQKGFTETDLQKCLICPEQKQIDTFNRIVEEIINGNAVLFIDKFPSAFSFGLKKIPQRAITEPPTSAVIKGPREGFVESLPVNISLMRRRIKSPDLKFINLTIGKYSKTTICICYIKSIADKSLVKQIIKKLSKINTDAILDSSYITKFLGEHKASIFKQVGNTEKPDILSAKILEGRVAIIVDGSPIVLTVPYLLIEDFQSPSDYYGSSYSATIARHLRLFSVILSVFLPAYYVSAELFHLQLIPLSFLLTIVNSLKGIPLSPSFEMFFTLLIFEILSEASVRMPKYVGMVVSIVGGLALGETAVAAGIISAPTLMIIALSGTCLYTVPELEQTFSVIRFIMLTVAGSFGGYGIIVSVAILLVYLVSFETFKTPLLSPFSPIVKADLKDGFYKGFLIEQEFRPESIKNINPRRMKHSALKGKK